MLVTKSDYDHTMSGATKNERHLSDLYSNFSPLTEYDLAQPI